ncbi:gamma-glutamylcyclotransferase family protein [Paracraurococcus lichenis]|uniref:Gamma-glutamylcyclotransferase family protein n=1 Tax=Paracraurococcus lichenis TaxID=3064888 RepID=A0ABT9DTH2_9PROT|nr:gamma-glutamylcyclotransferase family protein [Paracraurococcus sp. LOR1-02]MDO9707197.1 gamma-glutamylcyclotransferase family protein [Paracraurococcus sp. LOR1-02]
MILFLYGTLLHPAVLEAQAGQRGLGRRLRPARLDGWARVGLRGTPYPTLVTRPGAATEGAVLRVGPAALARLAAYEGAFYRLLPVRVATARGPVRARSWVAQRWRASGRAWSPGPAPRGRRDPSGMPAGGWPAAVHPAGSDLLGPARPSAAYSPGLGGRPAP